MNQSMIPTLNEHGELIVFRVYELLRGHGGDSIFLPTRLAAENNVSKSSSDWKGPIEEVLQAGNYYIRLEDGLEQKTVRALVEANGEFESEKRIHNLRSGFKVMWPTEVYNSPARCCFIRRIDPYGMEYLNNKAAVPVNLTKTRQNKIKDARYHCSARGWAGYRMWQDGKEIKAEIRVEELPGSPEQWIEVPAAKEMELIFPRPRPVAG